MPSGPRGKKRAREGEDTSTQAEPDKPSKVKRSKSKGREGATAVESNGAGADGGSTDVDTDVDAATVKALVKSAIAVLKKVRGFVEFAFALLMREIAVCPSAVHVCRVRQENAIAPRMRHS